MTFYPTPRFLVLLGLSVPIALGIGIFAPDAWAWVPLVAALLFLACLLDGVFAPVRQGLSFDIKPPLSLGVGRAVTVPFSARFTRSWQPGRLEVRLGLKALLGASVYDRFLTRAEGGAFEGKLTLLGMARGKSGIDAIYVRWQGFAGLVYVQKKLTLDFDITVMPDIHGVEQDAAHLFSRDNVYGVRVQNQLFNGSEYHALREYDASQDHRRIDWRSSARHMKLFSREYQAERNHHIVLAFDTGRLMGEPLAGLKRLDRAIYAGLLLGYTALKVGDYVRTFAFAAKPYHITPQISGVTGFHTLKYRLSQLEDSSEEANHTLALADLNAKVARRSLIILFSDFIDEISADLMIESLNRLSKKHLIIFVAFTDEVVEELMACPPVEGADVTRAVFAKRLSNQRERVFAQLRRQGIEVLETPTEHLATAIVSKYLALKRADRL